MLGVEGDAGFDVDVVARFAFAEQGHHVADLPFDRHVGDQALHGLRVEAWHAAGVWVAVGVAVADVEEEGEVVLARRIEMGGELGWGIGGGCHGGLRSHEEAAGWRWAWARAAAMSAARWW